MSFEMEYILYFDDIDPTALYLIGRNKIFCVVPFFGHNLLRLKLTCRLVIHST